MRSIAVVPAFLAIALVASCSGAGLSDPCRQRVNDCMRSCPANTIDRPSDRGFMQPADTRTDCERRCQEGCVP